MKKCFLFSFLLFSVSLFSQELSMGLKTGAGISIPFVDNSAKLNLDPKPSYALMNGLSLNYKTKGIFQIQADFLFTRKGYFRKSIFIEDSTTLDFKSTRSLDYFNISILPGIQTKGNTSFRINAGPYVGFFYNEGFTSKLEGYKQNTSNKAPKTLTSKQKIDFGAVLELALNHKINEKICFEFGSRTAMSIYNQTPFFIYKPVKYLTSNVFVGFKYNFGL